MTIAFFSNFINHHQYPFAQEMDRLTSGGFSFVEMQPIPGSFRRAGYPDFSNAPFVIKSWKDDVELERARNLAMGADVVLYGIDSIDLVKPRLKTDKISIDVGERWLKKGLINIFSPRLIKTQWIYHTQTNKDSNYKLCQSAFACRDLRIMHSFIGKCYKWGYFTKVSPLDVNALHVPRNCNKVSLMWCARMIDWKHPELPIKLAAKLKSSGYDFIMDIYGDGYLKQQMIILCKKLGVDAEVNFCGNVANDIILQEMQNHDIFLFTSDRNEGWGAVANEAMANGCVLVGSEDIGSVPYLVKDGKNGRSFRSKDVASLFTVVKDLIDDPVKRQELAVEAYNTISTTWSPANAAKNLLLLIQALQEGNDTPVKDGPCSKA